MPFSTRRPSQSPLCQALMSLQMSLSPFPRPQSSLSLCAESACPSTQLLSKGTHATLRPNSACANCHCAANFCWKQALQWASCTVAAVRYPNLLISCIQCLAACLVADDCFAQTLCAFVSVLDVLCGAGAPTNHCDSTCHNPCTDHNSPQDQLPLYTVPLHKWHLPALRT
jgi:hypothetical protein